MVFAIDQLYALPWDWKWCVFSLFLLSVFFGERLLFIKLCGWRGFIQTNTTFFHDVSHNYLPIDWVTFTSTVLDTNSQTIHKLDSWNGLNLWWCDLPMLRRHLNGWPTYLGVCGGPPAWRYDCPPKFLSMKWHLVHDRSSMCMSRGKVLSIFNNINWCHLHRQEQISNNDICYIHIYKYQHENERSFKPKLWTEACGPPAEMAHPSWQCDRPPHLVHDRISMC